MTAETDLLPLPEKWTAYACMTQGEMMDLLQAYARANLAERDAEVEALRAEVAEWKAVAKWEKEQHDRLLNEGRELTARAERLAEALLRYGRHEHDCATRHDAAHKDRPVCDCGLSAALEQENDDA